MQSPSFSSRTLVATRIEWSLIARLAAIDHRASARVHSVFRSAVNIVAGGGLVTIASDDSGGLPSGILVRGLPDVRTRGARPGMDVQIDRAAVRIVDAGLVVRLDSARPWSARIPVLDSRHWAGRSSVVHSLVAQVSGATDGRAVGLSAMPEARDRLAAVSRAIAHTDDPGAAAAARPLIGLGPGLTPSGDDALAGVEAALHALGHPMAGFLAPALADVSDRTTDVSATLLRHAAQGEFTERVQHLLGVLLGEDDTALPEAIERAIAWGATSGRDGLIGVLAGLDAGVGADRRRVS